jgi:hypothetical protein
MLSAQTISSSIMFLYIDTKANKNKDAKTSKNTEFRLKGTSEKSKISRKTLIAYDDTVI